MRGDDDRSDPRPLPRINEIGLDNFAPYLMNRIMGRYNANLRAEMAELGLSTAKMRTLAVLAVVDGIQISELAAHAVIEQSTLSRALNSLTADGFVHREPDPEDNRATRVCLTCAGRRAFDSLWPYMARSYEEMFRDIPHAERAAFVATLNRILRNLRKHDV